MITSPQKLILIIIGFLFMGVAYIGIIVPGLPTTPFLLISAGCFIRSSDRLYKSLLNNKIFGKYISDWYEKKGMTLKSKISAITMMLIMITVSVVFLINNLHIKIAVIAAGLIGLYFMGRIKVID